MIQFHAMCTASGDACAATPYDIERVNYVRVRVSNTVSDLTLLDMSACVMNRLHMVVLASGVKDCGFDKLTTSCIVSSIRPLLLHDLDTLSRSSRIKRTLITSLLTPSRISSMVETAISPLSIG
eukprot:3983373-Amphidinium_carterae.1